jgi:hypothetical protein
MLSITIQNIHFFVLTKIYLLQRGYLLLIAFLACPVLFNTSSLHFPEFVKIDPKYLNGLLPFNFNVIFKLYILYVTSYI